MFIGRFSHFHTENEEDALHNQLDQEDSSTILNECKRDVSRRRSSLAQKMTSNLRRLSGATELKIDMNDPIAANNPKYCNKKIKVSKKETGLRPYVKIFGKPKPQPLLRWEHSLGIFYRNIIQRKQMRASIHRFGVISHAK